MKEESTVQRGWNRSSSCSFCGKVNFWSWRGLQGEGGAGEDSDAMRAEIPGTM